MASLPSPTKVAGKHHPIYEAYYKQIDPKGTGTIEALAAAKFLKKSGLSDVVLSRIWDLSDPSGRGYLDKAGLFVALKLVALAQAGDTINMANIYNEAPNPPKVGEIPKILPPKIQSVAPTNDDWSIRPVDKLKYEELFESLQPSDGLLPGNKVRSVLMDSKLPLDALSKIWDLADQDRDGSLDKHEFVVAMHLVYHALDKRAVPQTLPPELQKSSRKSSGTDNGFIANFPKDIAPPPPVPPLPAVLSNIPPAIPPMPQLPHHVPSMQPLISMTDSLLGSPPSNDWVVTPAERIRFDGIFARSDSDKDGLVSGLEIKDVFMQSGIPQMCLAQIWALCDTNQSGKLTSEQFALAMWLVERKKNGIEPPNVLAPNMIPPSLRTASTNVGGIQNLIGETIAPIQPIEPQRPVYSNPELEMIAKEIEELAKERRLLETDFAQKEADIRIKTGEVRNLQSELDTLVATLKQLENQKGEAQKRLNDLKAQNDEIDESLSIVVSDIDVTREQVTKIREQCQKQEETIREQETELDSKRSELQKLKDEEAALENEYDENKRKLDKLSQTLQDTQLQICQIKALVTQLEENQRQMNDALAICKTAIEANDPSQASYFSLKIEPDFREASAALEEKAEPTGDPFNDKANGVSNGTSNPKFATTFDDNVQSSGFGAFDDGFGNNFSTKPSDPFTSTGIQDPFGDKKTNNAVTPDPNKDDFGSDPFAILHAPTTASQALSPMAPKSGPPPRPESPSPALPPKKAKQPPPRPAPPRPVQGPTMTKPDSGFGASSGSGFADFADFDNKNCGLSDFAEDPFKDYRYEDPFNIEDPFADATEDTFPSTELTSQKLNRDDNKKLNDSKSTKIGSNNNKDFDNAKLNPIEHHDKHVEINSKQKGFDDAFNVVKSSINNNNNGGKLTVNNNNSDTTVNKNSNVNRNSPSILNTPASDGDEQINSNSNRKNNNNNSINNTNTTSTTLVMENFANFDEFDINRNDDTSTDFFTEFNEKFSKRSNYDMNDAFGGVGFNSTTIDDIDSTGTMATTTTPAPSTPDMGSLRQNTQNSAINTKQSTLTKKINSHISKNNSKTVTTNVDDNFDDKFASFMTNDSRRTNGNNTNNNNNNNNSLIINKDANANRNRKNSNVNSDGGKPQHFGFDDDDSFADFGNAFQNSFDAFSVPSTKTYNQPTSRIAMTFPNLKTIGNKTSTTSKLKPIQGADFAKLNISDRRSNEKISTHSDNNGDGKGSTETIKLPLKFSNDYSKNEEFDIDLQNVLARSLVDQ